MKNRSEKTGIKRQVVEWALLLGIALALYLSGLHTEVIGRVQQVVLWTGLIQADTSVAVDEQAETGYDLDLLTPGLQRTGLDEFRGKVVFLNYWATWCPPCIAEMPNIQDLYMQYGEKEGMAFVMVSLDQDREKAREFIRRKGFTFPYYFLGGPRPGRLQSDVIPTTYVIDRNGRIATSRQGMANYNTERFKAFLDRLLAGR